MVVSSSIQYFDINFFHNRSFFIDPFFNKNKIKQINKRENYMTLLNDLFSLSPYSINIKMPNRCRELEISNYRLILKFRLPSYSLSCRDLSSPLCYPSFSLPTAIKKSTIDMTDNRSPLSHNSATFSEPAPLDIVKAKPPQR